MLVRPTPWGRGKSSWGPWNGLGRGIVGRFRREMEFLEILEDSDRLWMCSGDVVQLRSVKRNVL